MKCHVVVCALAVALLAMHVSGQTAAGTGKQGSGQTAARVNNKAIAAPARGAKLGVQIPQLIAYQGKLTDSTGRPVNDGKYVMIFSLYADSFGTIPFWRETQTVETKDGLFSVLLGDVDSIPVDSVQKYRSGHLGIRLLPSAGEFSRRQRIVSVPFAFQTDNTDKLQGKDTTALWNAKTLQGKDTTGFVRTGQASSITASMIVDTNVTLAKLQQAGADTNQAMVWNGSKWAPAIATASNADMVDRHHAGNGFEQVAVSNDTVCAHLNAGQLQSKDTTALWNAKTLQGKDTTALWNAKTLQGKDTTALWNAKTLQGKDTNQLKAVFGTPNDNAATLQTLDTTALKSRSLGLHATADSALGAGRLQGKDTSALKAVFGTPNDNAATLQTLDTTTLKSRSLGLHATADSALAAGRLQGKDTSALDVRYVNEGQANSITTGMIVDGQVQTNDIADNAVTTAKIAADAVDSTKIGTGAVTTAKIADLNVTTGKIADKAVTTAKIANSSVTLAKILDEGKPGQAIIAQGAGKDPIWGYPSAVGTAGTSVTFIKTGTFTLDLGTLPTGVTQFAVDTISAFSSLQVGDRVFLSYPITGTNPDWQYVQGLGNCQVTATSEITFRVWNSYASNVTPGSGTWQYIWIRP